MIHLILFDNEVREQLLPFTFTRPVCELRLGMLTIREKWERWMGGKVSYITQDYLAEKYPIDYGDENYVINGSVLPSEQLCRLLRQMDVNDAFLHGEELIAAKLNEEQFERLVNDEDIGELQGRDLEDTQFLKIDHLWDLFRLNGPALADDYALLTRGRVSQPLSASNRVIGNAGQIFLDEGASVEGAVLNTTDGPIYIGRNATVMEGSLIRGGFFLGEGSTLKMGARIYGPTSIGPRCKVGGEVKNSLFYGNSNKSHEGYIGNSVIGEWCNLGADTNCSNLKNTFGEVTLWNYAHQEFVATGQQFCGLFMGDYSCCSINTMFNTGTVVGVSANIFGEGFPPRFIPSFSWGGRQGLETYRPEKAFDTMERIRKLLGVDFDIPDRLILLRIFEDSARYRSRSSER